MSCIAEGARSEIDQQESVISVAVVSQDFAMIDRKKDPALSRGIPERTRAYRSNDVLSGSVLKSTPFRTQYESLFMTVGGDHETSMFGYART